MPKTMDQKREEAVERQKAYAALSPEERMARIEGRRGNSERERLRILHSMEKRSKPHAKNKGGKKKEKVA